MSADPAAAARPPASHEAQLDLRTFLTSIHAGLSAPSPSGAQEDININHHADTTKPTPSLPASARVSMLDAQLDTVRARIRAALVEHEAHLLTAGRATVQVHRDVRALQAQVERMERQRLGQVQDRIPADSPLPGALEAYTHAHEQALYEAYTLATLRALHGAVASLERLEGSVAAAGEATGAGAGAGADAEAQEQAQELERYVADARAACAEVGVALGGSEATAAVADKELAWLGRGGGPAAAAAAAAAAAPGSNATSPVSKLKWWQRAEAAAAAAADGLDLPAVRLLGPRLEEAVRAAETLVQRQRRRGAQQLYTGSDAGDKDAGDGHPGALSPADEVRRKARALLLSEHGWAPVVTVDLSAAGPASTGDDADTGSPYQSSPQLVGSHSPPPAGSSRNRTAALRGGGGGGGGSGGSGATCVISQRSVDLVQLAEDTLVQARMRAKRLTREVNRASSAGGGGSGESAAAYEAQEVRLRAIAGLLRAIPDIFALHLALMPTLHPQSLFGSGGSSTSATTTTTTTRAMQFANDCSHLSAQCVRLGNVLLIASHVRDELGRLVNARRGEQGEGVLRRAVEGAAQGLEEASQGTMGLGLRVLNRQMMLRR